MTALSVWCLRRNSAGALLSPDVESPFTELLLPPPKSDVDLPIISYRSEFASSITALETGYLLQDFLILIWALRLHRQARGKGSKPLKGLNIRHLAWHHSFLVCGLSILQWYIARGKEKGLVIIIMMLLMNASSPIGTFRWYLANFRPGYKRAIIIASVSYVAMYGLCRVYLIHYILKIFGAQRGQSAAQAFARLRIPCKLGTGAMSVVHSTWLIIGISRFITRDLGLRIGTRSTK